MVRRAHFVVRSKPPDCHIASDVVLSRAIVKSVMHSGTAGLMMMRMAIKPLEESGSQSIHKYDFIVFGVVVGRPKSDRPVERKTIEKST